MTYYFSLTSVRPINSLDSLEWHIRPLWSDLYQSFWSFPHVHHFLSLQLQIQQIATTLWTCHCLAFFNHCIYACCSSALKYLWHFKAYKIWNITSCIKPSLTTDELLISLLVHEYFKYACTCCTSQLLRYLAYWNSTVSDSFLSFLLPHTLFH